MMMCEGTGQTRTLTGHVRLVRAGKSSAETGQTRTHPFRGVRLSGPPMPRTWGYQRIVVNDPRGGDVLPVVGPSGDASSGGRGAPTFAPVRGILNWKNSIYS